MSRGTNLERIRETHSPSRQDAKRTHAPGPDNMKEAKIMSINELDMKVKELRELRRMADELAGEMEAIQDQIKAHMETQDVDTLTGTDWKVTWKPVTSTRLDTGALKKVLPEVAERFMKSTTSRRFVLA